MKKTIDWNEKLSVLFRRKRAEFGQKGRTAWANYLRSFKIKQHFVTGSRNGTYYDRTEKDIITVINSTKRRYVWIVGERVVIRKRPKNGHRYVLNATEILLIPPKLAQKILVLGGLP